jgi:hypothetical protein
METGLINLPNGPKNSAKNLITTVDKMAFFGCLSKITSKNTGSQESIT